MRRRKQQPSRIWWKHISVLTRRLPCPDAGLEMLREAVKATGRGLHIHAAEDLYDVSYSHHWYGKDLLARLTQFESHRQQNTGRSWAVLVER